MNSLETAMRQVGMLLPAEGATGVRNAYASDSEWMVMLRGGATMSVHYGTRHEIERIVRAAPALQLKVAEGPTLSQRRTG
jgi:hypothetical protein